METKKRNKWLSKIIVIVLIVGCVAVYFCVPSVNKLMNRIFAAFASVCSSPSSGIPDHICERKLIRMVAGSDSFLVKCDGRSSALLLYRKNSGKRCS